MRKDMPRWRNGRTKGTPIEAAARVGQTRRAAQAARAGRTRRAAQSSERRESILQQMRGTSSERLALSETAEEREARLQRLTDNTEGYISCALATLFQTGAADCAIHHVAVSTTT